MLEILNKYYNVKDLIVDSIKKGENIQTLSKIYNIPIKTLYTWKYRNN
jgi:hypothetical protein